MGLALFRGGQVGLAGWLIASVSIVQPGGVSSAMSALRGTSFGVPITVFYVLMSLAGLVISIYEIEAQSPKNEQDSKSMN